MERLTVFVRSMVFGIPATYCETGKLGNMENFSAASAPALRSRPCVAPEHRLDLEEFFRLRPDVQHVLQLAHACHDLICHAWRANPALFRCERTRGLGRLGLQGRKFAGPASNPIADFPETLDQQFPEVLSSCLCHGDGALDWSTA